MSTTQSGARNITRGELASAVLSRRIVGRRACELPAPPTRDLVGGEAGRHGWTGPNADYRLTGVKRDQAPTPPLPAAACPGAFRARTPGPTYSSVSTWRP